MPSETSRPLLARQAVVVGAGVGGLTAARALADRFERVTVLERDDLDDSRSAAVHRPGTPQGRHAHGLLGGGQRALVQLFPGFDDDLLAAGARTYRPGLDTRIERPGFDPFPQRDLGWVTYSMSRPVVELAIRRRVAAIPNVEVRGHCRVHALETSDDGSAVTGVRYERAGGREETLAADLVVDASGRGALTVAALQASGRPAPAETSIVVDFGYATGLFEIPADPPADWTCCLCFPEVPR